MSELKLKAFLREISETKDEKTLNIYIHLISFLKNIKNPEVTVTGSGEYLSHVFFKLFSEKHIIKKYSKVYRDLYEYMEIKPIGSDDFILRSIRTRIIVKYFGVFVEKLPFPGIFDLRNFKEFRQKKMEHDEKETKFCDTLISDIKRDFRTKQSDYSHYIQISVDQINQFLDKYQTVEEVRCASIASNTDIPWTNELICKYSEVWNWQLLHENPTVIWNFELIDANIERVNWAYVSSYPFLDWSIEHLTKYKDYLVFGRDQPWAKGGKNRKGKYYQIQSSSKFYSTLKGSISLSENICWTREIIASVKDYWNWKELCANTSIGWNEELIDFFIEYVNFDSLCSNHSIHWSERLLDKYFNEVNWKNLSGNPNLPWSYDLIEKYEEKWLWIPEFNWYPDDETNDSPSLSTNAGITWDVEILEKCVDKIDFWRIARKGTIPEKSIIKFHKEFNRKELVGWQHHKWSDWRVTSEIYRTGWENLHLNPAFSIPLTLIEFLYETKIELTFADGNLAHDGNYVTKEFRLLEILKQKNITNLTFSELVNMEPNRGEILLNDQFINDTIWNEIIKSMFTDGIVENYLKYFANHFKLSRYGQ